MVAALIGFELNVQGLVKERDFRREERKINQKYQTTVSTR
jgi:hypothetical protein